MLVHFFFIVPKKKQIGHQRNKKKYSINSIFIVKEKIFLTQFEYFLNKSKKEFEHFYTNTLQHWKLPNTKMKQIDVKSAKLCRFVSILK